MTLETLLYKTSTGLNTVVSPHRLQYSPDTGVQDLASAVNVTIDASGQIGRRKGYTKLANLVGAHSLFCDGHDCIVAAGTKLYTVNQDYSLNLVRQDLIEGLRIDYVQINTETYYSNGTQLGIIRNGLDVPWVKAPYIGPSTNQGFNGPVPGNHISFLGGRIYTSNGPNIFYSEPFSWSEFDLSKSFYMMDSKVLMLKAVASGMFISTESTTYFLKGLKPSEQELIQVAPYPCYEWSAAIDLVEGLEIGIQESGPCALWMSKVGACLGTPSGNFTNLTRQKIQYPSSGLAGASLLNGYDFIQSIL